MKPKLIEGLAGLPNLDRVLVEQLHRAGVPSSEALEAIGAEAAWELIAAAKFRPTIQTLFALDGAINRVPWQDLPATRRFQLMRYFVQHAA